MSNDVIENTGYEVITVEKTTAPDGVAGNNWYRYVIGYGRSKIVGKKTGTLKKVTEHANMMVEQINSRHGNKGTYPSPQPGKRTRN